MRSLYLLTHDLRLNNNRVLDAICQNAYQNSQQVVFMYCFDPFDEKATHFQSKRLGQGRKNLIFTALNDLRAQLTRFGHQLLVLNSTFEKAIAAVLKQYAFNTLFYSQPMDAYTLEKFERLQQHNASYDPKERIQFQTIANHCLFDPSQLPFDLDQLPDSFSKFRKKAERLDVPKPSQYNLEVLQAVTLNLDEPSLKSLICDQPRVQLVDDHSTMFCQDGGETAGYKQLQNYLESHRIQTYKQTRNQLDGWDFSSKLSFWLAHGALSPRAIWHKILDYEANVCANESTYWLRFELLWREYFQWYALAKGQKLYNFAGLKKSPLTSFYPSRFKAWTSGQTPYPVVNAAIHQLNETGYVSNRARQWLASCFVHELALDWRYGAAYFQEHLLDYNPGANWGNWQYLAGVGADPRGHRQFNLEKQASTYDPDSAFVKRWGGDQNISMIDTVDCADWPIE